jgi:hypothetical protein
MVCKKASTGCSFTSFVELHRRLGGAWRLLDLPKIEDCEVLNESFAGSRGHLHSRRLIWDVLYMRVG